MPDATEGPRPSPAAPAATPAGAVAGPMAAGTASTPLPVLRRSAAVDLALVSTFAAFVAVCAVLPAIPTGVSVPITLQTFAVMLTGLVLGPRRGALAVLLYLAVGFAGLPVFAGGSGGLGVLGGASAGYLLAFPLAAVVAGAVGTLARRVRPGLRVVVLFGAATSASLLTVHPLGIAVMGWRLGLSAGEAVSAGAVFLPGDVIKNVLAAVVAAAVFRAFPDLLRGRR
ncbi:biotin transporter BioY [Cellulomonas hominis]